MTLRKTPRFLLLMAGLLAGLLVSSVSAQAALPLKLADGSDLPSLSPMLEEVSPAVVNIAIYAKRAQRRNPLLEDPFFRRFFNLPDQPMPRERRTVSAGSGVIVDAEKGYVLTNAHVVNGADQIEITLVDGRTLQAELVGTDTEVDIAVLKLEEANNLTPIRFADSTRLRVGDFVVAIGNPFGLGQTVTSGIISALSRTGLGLEGYEDFIQTDASINPGNSGGALVNLRGELIGINTAIIAPAGGNVGIGFAIPTEMAANVMHQLIEYGEVRRGVLGVHVQDLTAELAEAFDVKRTEGVLITQVMEDSAAADAGLRAGDVVISVDGRPVRKASDLRNRIGLSPVGSKVELVIVRDGRQKTVKTVIRETHTQSNAGAAVSRYLEGANLRDVRPNEVPYSDTGVLVEEVERGGAAWRAGIRPGDIIITANRQVIENMEQLRAAVSDREASLLLRINRKGNVFFVVIR